MAGIYIHIPFCRQACHYCDFHFSVNQASRPAIADAITMEIAWQKNYIGNEIIRTIYFGGGTPSLLDENELAKIFEQLQRHFNIDQHAEITLEANPDDLTKEKISILSHSPVNRLSIGIQSFNDHDLQWMNRAHRGWQASKAIQDAQDAGFNNLSIDLIYGLPDSTDTGWNQNMDTALAAGVQHISCYCLTVEPKTALAHFISSGKSKPVNEEQSARQFEMLMEKMKRQQWLHYEISNFAIDELHCSKHNTAYWKGEKYLGIGPSAHSYNGVSRQWNVANNHHYLSAIRQGMIACEKEILTPTQQINERIMTQLRTVWGLQLTDFDTTISRQLHSNSLPFIAAGLATLHENLLTLTDSGKLIADRIIVELMLEDPS
ncbi:MAG: radical SAM family heme chaperone HemW [Chitinophagales bacterium]|nr:radical SAM family heme chaperone HemW [Chitinophagales bacterium]